VFGMKHLGDITKIKGCNAPVVDCIIGGSPCQDLSVAGKRAGLAGERSGLYMEQIRIIKEMRHKDEQRGRTGESIRPRYMVWENVPGAFSSNQGKDFAAVIEEAIKVADPEATSVPLPEKGWPTSGCFMGDTWSVAWRVLDAQFWGVPQRRRRIALVADFGGQSAPEILFIRKGVSRDIDEGQQKRKATAGDAKDCTGADDRDGIAYTLKIRGGCSGGGKGALIQTDRSATLSTLQDQTLFQPVSIENHPADSGGNVPMVMEPVTLEPGIAAREGGHIYEGVSGTLRAKAGDNQMAGAYGEEIVSAAGFCTQQSAQTRGVGFQEEVSPTLISGAIHSVCYNIGSYHSNAWKSDNPHSGVYEADKSKTLDALQCGYPGCNQGGTEVVEPAYSIGNGQVNQSLTEEVAGALNCMHDQQAILQPVEEPIVIDRAFFNQGKNALYEPRCYEDGIVPTLVAKGPGAVAHGVDCRNATEYEEQTGALQSSACHNMNSNNVVRVRYIVRRLTPLECERLQGYPDGWTDIGEWVDSKGKKHKDADAPRYKALGNSIAIPPWKWVLKRLCACYERDATMASLFDGIGGFPYIWEQINGKGSCLWASEIEDFPMAVTKLRFGG
jgi:DNA (cytosine-5)-methyltransferase 1